MNHPSRVLIVDDKEENLYYLQALLGGHGCVVESARHGAEALVKARLAPPDLVVSDLLMPVMDGYTLLRHWKADPRLKHVPFIVYTATYTEAEDERLALNLGADAFILKPAEPEAFLARLREVQANVAAAVPALPKTPIGDEKALLKVYSETLIRKLEEKTMQLEEANQALQQDIARRQQVEEQLRESEERFRATFEQAAVGIAHVGGDGRFLRVNDKLCEITGYLRAELLQMDFNGLTVVEDRETGEVARQAMLARRQDTYTFEKRYRKKNGEIFWGNLVTTLLRDPAGGPKYFISVIADISGNKILQEQLLRAQRLESIGTLAGGMAHDLNNLLTPVLMGVGLLKLSRQDDGSLRVIDTIERSAKRGTELLKQVLSFARGMAGERVAVHLGHVAQEIAAMVKNTFPKNIEFRTDIPKDGWPVLGDPTQLNQILLNLCVNARDAMPSGGQLTVRARNAEVDAQYAATNPGAVPGRFVRLEVTDTGTGMTKEIVDRIFEPFFTTKEIGKGTGLGLSTVVGIVRSHGGFLRVDSQPGRGSTFNIYLPAQADGVASQETPVVAEPPRRGEGQLVLVVDDEDPIVSITRQTLEHHGYRVLTASNGVEAVALFAARRTEVAVVLTDMMMPVMDGSALIAALQRIDPAVRIIAASGLDARAEIIRSTIPGVGYLLAKPYTSHALLRVVADLLAEAGKPRPPDGK
jgi:two-component system cell cycle sensor histidine kinase/response regulator CckA